MAQLAPNEAAGRISAIPAPPASISYRCPGCGDKVDGSDRNEVSLHYLHVLHPHLFRFGRSGHQPTPKPDDKARTGYP